MACLLLSSKIREKKSSFRMQEARGEFSAPMDHGSGPGWFKTWRARILFAVGMFMDRKA